MRLVNSLGPAFLVNIHKICLSQLQAVIFDQLHLMTITINFMQRIAFLSIQTQFWCQLHTTCCLWLRARISSHIGSNKWWSYKISCLSDGLQQFDQTRHFTWIYSSSSHKFYPVTMICWRSSVIPWTLCPAFSILKLMRKMKKSRVGICIWTNSISCDSPFAQAQWTSSIQDCQ